MSKSLSDRLRRPLLWWLLLAGVVVCFQGERLLRNLRPPPDRPMDFFQDWASAKNFLAGRPVYELHVVTTSLYLQCPAVADERSRIEINAHPPPAVLVVLPFAGLSYQNAHLLWNLLSLTALAASVLILWRSLGLPLGLWTPILAVAVLTSHPLQQQLIQGQWNLVLLLLLVLVWAGDRAGRTVGPGLCLGLAAALKLFPAFLVLYFLAARRWRAAFVAVGTFVLLNALAALLLGFPTYRDYITKALPQVQAWRGSACNCSVTGFFCQLFDPGTKGRDSLPLLHAPEAARSAILVVVGAIALTITFAAARARTPRECDGAFAMAVIGMVLASPTSWESYALLLLLPLALLWADAPASGLWRGTFWALAALCWLKPGCFFLPSGQLAPWWYAATVIAICFYARVALFMWASFRQLQRKEATLWLPRSAAAKDP